VTASTIFFVMCGMAALIGAAYALLHPLHAEANLGPKARANPETLTIRHCQHFAQMRRTIDAADFEFVLLHLPAARCRQLRQERRKVLRKYLDGIADDFARLDQLARIVASLSPEIDKGQELQRIQAEVAFRVYYRVAAFRLWTGSGIPNESVVHLADMVATLSRDIETAMTGLQRHGSPHLVNGD